MLLYHGFINLSRGILKTETAYNLTDESHECVMFWHLIRVIKILDNRNALCYTYINNMMVNSILSTIETNEQRSELAEFYQKTKNVCTQLPYLR